MDKFYTLNDIMSLVLRSESTIRRTIEQNVQECDEIILVREKERGVLVRAYDEQTTERILSALTHMDITVIKDIRLIDQIRGGITDED